MGRDGQKTYMGMSVNERPGFSRLYMNTVSFCSMEWQLSGMFRWHSSFGFLGKWEGIQIPAGYPIFFVLNISVTISKLHDFMIKRLILITHTQTPACKPSRKSTKKKRSCSRYVVSSFWIVKRSSRMQDWISMMILYTA